MRSRSAVLALVVAVAVAGCTSLPTGGGVRVADGVAPSPSAAPFDFNPPGPAAGATPEQVVSGFLNALQASPMTTRVAAGFLTEEALEEWRPGRRTVVFATQQVVARGQRITVELGGAHALDAQGRWLGPVTSDGRLDLEMQVARQDGEWRVTDPPDAVVIPQAHFQARYRQYHLHFFDATGSVLVPEPVYLPRGVQTPSLLVAGLLAGPAERTPGVERTYFPTGTRLGVGVPVGDDGVAVVPLSDEMLGLQETSRDLALAQLAWTLRQVEEIERLAVTVDGRPVELPGGRMSLDVDGWPAVSPAVAAASTDVFGLRRREIRQVAGESEIVAATVPGQGSDGVAAVGSLGVSMDGQRMAVVDAVDGRVVLLARDGSDRPPTTAYDGTDVLRPLWDRMDILWLLDRTVSGLAARVWRDGQVLDLPVTGVGPGTTVAAALSRDGSRLVLVQRQAGRDRLLLMRVARSAQGVPMRLTPARVVALSEPLTGAVAVGWRTSTVVAVLIRSSTGSSSVSLVDIDGSTGFARSAGTVDPLFEEGIALAASPGGPQALLVGTAEGRLHALDPQGRWDFEAIPTGLLLPTFVG